MSIVLFILSLLILYPFIRAFAKWGDKCDQRAKKNGIYLPPKYHAQRAGIRAKDEEYYYWEKKDREIEKRRALAKQKRKEERRKLIRQQIEEQRNRRK